MTNFSLVFMLLLRKSVPHNKIILKLWSKIIKKVGMLIYIALQEDLLYLGSLENYVKKFGSNMAKNLQTLFLNDPLQEVVWILVTGSKKYQSNKIVLKLRLVVNPVIKAFLMLEFEDGLRVCYDILVAALSPESIQNPFLVLVSPGPGVVVIWTPVRPISNFAKFRTSVVLKLELVWC